MPEFEDAPRGGKWPRREWRDPATVVGVLLLLFGLFLIVLDGLDTVLFGKDITFGYWPLVLIGAVVFWFMGIRLGRFGGGEE